MIPVPSVAHGSCGPLVRGVGRGPWGGNLGHGGQAKGRKERHVWAWAGNRAGLAWWARVGHGWWLLEVSSSSLSP